MKRIRQPRCSVVGCTDQHKCLHVTPASEDTREKWIYFIFEGNVPSRVGKYLLVCSNHFESDCFINLGQYTAGLAGRLILKGGSLPSIRRRTEDEGNASTSVQGARVHHVACQTDPPKMCTVGTQLSVKTQRPHYKSTGTQKTVPCTDVGVGTSAVAFKASQPFLTSAPIKWPSKRPRLEEEEDSPFDGSSSMDFGEPQDATYDPDDSVTVLTESADVTMESSNPFHKTPTYIVYENCLLELFEVCPVCRQVTDVQTRRVGTFLSVEQKCPHCEFYRKWNSQPILGSTPVGNIQLSAAVYATGASFFKLEKIFRAMQLRMFHYDTFRRHARLYIEPAIVHSWKTAQDGMLDQLCQQQKVILGGDLRADSPGHCAKFGSYTVMDLTTNTVIDLQLVQSNEVGGSYHMEKEGLKRSLALLEARGVTLDSIVTDRHPQIQKFLREANITHYYDVLHMEKGLSKKLEKTSQNKECEKLKKWLCSIKNHIYWTAATSTSGPERVAKWTSILNHVQDIHSHEDPVFPQCLHPRRTSRDKSKWLTAGTPAFCRLEKVLSSKKVLKDVEKLSPHYQTSSLESFHSVILRFAPKNGVFPFLGMLCRLYLAALHFNENAGRPQATSSAGEPLFRVNFPKYKKGECTAKPVKVDPTFHYVDNLLDLIFQKVFQDPAPYVNEVLKIPIPEDLSAKYAKPDKWEVITSYVSRFNQEQV
ncbi:uncharacterized protein LOC105898184 isoform X2 [Clupea harengus]|uniref:Uncharacterized protein LOC105898184 isoform X2 n=1 Tax=Clupea harengus TaxID=7950 RepID=A0A6P8G031_CLUHA|nr:uncharacterized protein LOC105898184 isoform X2 [Clupea harengus]